MAAKSLDLTAGNPRRQLLAFFLPLLLANTLQQFYNLANTWLVGNYISKDALAAVSAANPLILVFSYLFFGLGTGAGIIIANLYGAKKEDRIQKAIDTAIITSIVGGIIITIISEMALPFLMAVSGIGEALWDMTSQYLRVYLAGNAAVLIYNMAFFIMRSLGDSRQPLIYLFMSCLLNIGLGIYFVRGLGMSIAGAALATVISQVAVDIVILIRMAKGHSRLLHIDFKHMQFEGAILKDILRLGIPAGIQNMLLALSQMMVQYNINQFSTEVIAGIGAASKISGFAQIPMSSISTACMSFCGQNYGAKKFDRVQQGIKDSIRLSNMAMLVVAVVIFAAAPQLISLFNADSQVIYYGANMIRHTVFFLIPLGWSHVYNGACRGAGNMRIPLIIAVMCQCIARALFVYTGLSIYYSVDILYWSEAVAYGLAGICATIYFYTSRWTRQAGLRV